MATCNPTCLCPAGFQELADGNDKPKRYLQPDLNAGGALDVIFIAHDDGSVRSTDFYVVFNHLDFPDTVSITINGQAWDTGPCVMRASAAWQPTYFECPGSDSVHSIVPPAHLLQALARTSSLRSTCNEICYSVNDTKYTVRAFLYIWRASLPAVIFDVDGTVTLSDIAGQVANLIDGSPTHVGICEMLCALHARGYLILYLTSRPLLGASGIERTRRFLFQVAVDSSGFRMPPVPKLQAGKPIQPFHLAALIMHASLVIASNEF